MYYWQIDDGRIWSADDAAFVGEAPAGADLVPLYSDGQPGGVEYLRDTIRFYGYGLGELAGPEERKAAILARLAEIDLLSIRPLRAVADGSATDFDKQKLAALDSEATEQRAELAEMGDVT
jgi:hypothetical protein